MPGDVYRPNRRGPCSSKNTGLALFVCVPVPLDGIRGRGDRDGCSGSETVLRHSVNARLRAFGSEVGCLSSVRGRLFCGGTLAGGLFPRERKNESCEAQEVGDGCLACESGRRRDPLSFAGFPAGRATAPVRAVRRQGLSETNPTGCGGKSPAVFIVGKKMLVLRRFTGGVLPRRLCRLAGVRVPAIVSFDDRRTRRVCRKVFGVRDRGRFGFFGLRPLPVSANGFLSDGTDRPR